eukprot:g33945.t1
MVKTQRGLGLGVGVELVAACGGGDCLRSERDVSDVVGIENGFLGVGDRSGSVHGVSGGSSSMVCGSKSDVNTVSGSDEVSGISGRSGGHHVVNGGGHIEVKILGRVEDLGGGRCLCLANFLCLLRDILDLGTREATHYPGVQLLNSRSVRETRVMEKMQASQYEKCWISHNPIEWQSRFGELNLLPLFLFLIVLWLIG